MKSANASGGIRQRGRLAILFATLTARNSPERIQPIILGGSTPSISASCGGVSQGATDSDIDKQHVH
jgi:hypothetical protein